MENSSGGQAVFCKNNFSHTVPIERTSQNAQWVKIKKEFIGSPHDISTTIPCQNVYQELTDGASFFQD